MHSGKRATRFLGRTALHIGLAGENLWGACFFIDTEIELPAEKSVEEFQENLEMLGDLEGECYTNVKANAERFEFMDYLPPGGDGRKDQNLPGHRAVLGGNHEYALHRKDPAHPERRVPS